MSVLFFYSGPPLWHHFGSSGCRVPVFSQFGLSIPEAILREFGAVICRGGWSVDFGFFRVRRQENCFKISSSGNIVAADSYFWQSCFYDMEPLLSDFQFNPTGRSFNTHRRQLWHRWQRGDDVVYLKNDDEWRDSESLECNKTVNK